VPGAARLRRGVEPVLEHVEIETAEILGAIGLQPLHDEVEFVARVIGSHRGEEAPGLREREAVELEELGRSEPRTKPRRRR
jgi:hypothetical protein